MIQPQLKTTLPLSAYPYLPAITNGGSSNGNTAGLPPINFGILTSPTAQSQQGRSRSDKRPPLGRNGMASYVNRNDTGHQDFDDEDYDDLYANADV